MHQRSRARAWALQVLYAWEMRGRAGSPRELLGAFIRDRNIAESNRAYIETLISTVEDHLDAVDTALAAALTNWRLERLSAIDRSILRIGAAELLYLDDVPPRVSIQEGINLAEKYGSADSPRFVNGVLDALMRRSDRPAGTAGEPR